MILGVYLEEQVADYLSDFFNDIRKFLKIDKEVELYWCLPMNNIYQAIIGSYMTMPFCPIALRLFETDNFFAIDHVKYIRYLNGDKSLTVSDLFNIEHKDTIRYIVTEFPDKFIDIPLISFPDKEGMFKNFHEIASCEKYSIDVIGSFWLSLLNEEIRLNPIIEIPKKLIPHKKFWLSNKEFMLFRYYCLPVYYIVGMEYLGYIMRLPTIPNEHDTSSIFYISLDYSNLITWEFDNIEQCYIEYQGHYNVVWEEILGYKNIKPNEFCPCGSGLKYKKCCMDRDKMLFDYLSEI